MTTLTPADIGSAAAAAGFTPVEILVAIPLAYAESGGNPEATNHNSNGSTDYGVWQINSIHKEILASGNWADVRDNAKMARQVYLNAGGSWEPWSAYNNGAYLKYADRGREYVPGDTATTPTPTTTTTPAWNPLDPLGVLGFLTVLGNPDFWKRVGIVALGGALVIAAFLILFRRQVGTVAKNLPTKIPL